MTAVPESAQYLHEKLSFCYILIGKFTSDPIEARFGWYRKAKGGNFFMSLKQVLEVEKKIRRLSLLQKYSLPAASKLHVNDDTPLATTTRAEHPALKFHGWSTSFQRWFLTICQKMMPT